LVQLDDEIIGRKKFVGYTKSMGGILPFRAIEVKRGTGLVQTVGVELQEWSCSWTGGQWNKHHCTVSVTAEI
jgi:hypothetical protein